ncbi:unnamed protein product [Effrenium voratum]|nr:unnamed protein product [Effrenium voratum]
MASVLFFFGSVLGLSAGRCASSLPRAAADSGRRFGRFGRARHDRQMAGPPLPRPALGLASKPGSHLPALQALQANMRPDVVAYTRAVASATWLQAVVLLAEAGARNLQADLILLSAVARRCELEDSAWRIVQQLLQKMLHMDAFAVSLAVNSCRKALAWQSAANLLQDRQTPASSMARKAALLALPQSAWRAMRLPEEEDDIEVQNTALKLLVGDVQWRLAQAHFQQLLTKRVQISRVTSNSLISYGSWQRGHAWVARFGCDRVGLNAALHLAPWRQSLALHHALGEGGFDAAGQGAVAKACEEGAAWAAALRLPPFRSSAARSCAAGACARAGRVLHAEALLEARREEAEPASCDTGLFNTVMSGYQWLGRWRDTLRLLRRLLQCQLEAQVVSFNVVIGACGEAWRKAQLMLEELAVRQLRASTVSFNSAIAADGRWEGSLQLLRRLEARALPPTRVSFNAAIAALGGAWWRSWDLLRELRDHGLEGDVASYGALAAECGGVIGGWRRAKTLMEILRRQQLALNLALSAALVTSAGGTWREAQQAQNSGDFGIIMATVAAKDVYVTWDGDPSGWGDYLRKVRLQYDKTAEDKKKLLGPELVSRLTDKAWAVCAEVDYNRLKKRSGTRYLLIFLRDKLCRTPVPDVGTRLEELFVKLRRSPGVSMAQWSQHLRETYKRLQRSLLRVRQDRQLRGVEAPTTGTSPTARADLDASRTESGSGPPEERRPRSHPASPTTSATTRVIPEAPAAGDGERDGDGAVAEETRAASEAGGSPGSEWSWGRDEWRHWDWSEWQGGRRGDEEDEEDMPGTSSRSGLSAQARLSVLASTHNSLMIEDVERALRDQEEELLFMESKGQQERNYHRPKRTYWVEESQEWGLLDYEPEEEVEPTVHWVGRQLPDEVHARPDPPEVSAVPEAAWWSDSWTDPWNGQDGIWAAAETDFSQDELKELEEAYAVYEGKLRTFAQARALMKNSGSSPSYGIFMVTPWDLDVNEDVIGDDGIMLATEEAHGWRAHGVIDCGATETVASLQAIEELMARRRELRDGQEEAIRVFSDVRKQFRFGNGQELQASSYIEIPQQINGCTFYLGIFTLDTEGYVPVLLGIKTLHRLGTVVDFANHRAAFTQVCQDWLPLVNCERTGHLLVDMSLDWMTPQFTTVYMAREGWFDLGTEVVEVPFEGHAPVEDEQDADVKFAAMAMIHMEKEIAQRETFAVGKPKSKAKGKSKGSPKVKIPDSDKYDFSREEKTDPRDPRAQGPPCNGTHEPMPMGRGSLSGKNGHAMWLTCQRCRIRLSYVPAIGAHARFRQSPPLAKDVEDTLKEKINEVETQPEILNTANVALDGAERSLMKKLDAVRAQKETAYQRSKMNLSKKMAKRVGEETAEEAETTSQHSWILPDGGEAANTVEMVEEAMADVESMCMMNSKAPVDLVEMCCPPDSSLAQMVLDLGGTAVRISEHNMNLSTRAGLEQALDFVRKEKPRWLWASFPCGPTSQVQSLNELTPEAKEKSLMRKKKSRRLVRRGLQVLRVHVFENGGQFAWEWPQSNQGWWFPEVQHFLKDVYQKTELYKTILHGCQVGVRADDGGFMKKPWKIYTTDRELATSLNLTCPGNHAHSPCLEGSNTARSAFYTEKMVRIIARRVLESKFAVPSYMVDNQDGMVFGTEEGENQDEAIPEGVTPELWQRVQDVVHKLHARAGHPSNRALESSLRARGADEVIIKAARNLQCDACKEAGKAVPVARATFGRADTLWHTLQMDVGYFRWHDEMTHVLFLVDEASTFVVPHFLFTTKGEESRNATAEEVVNALESTWAHWQIGTVERMIGVIRKSLDRFMRSEETTMWQGVMAMCAAHNENGKVGGFSPNQWALGRDPGLDLKLHESGRDAAPLHLSQRDPKDELSKTMATRMRAEENYKRMVAQEAINRAWNSRARSNEVYLPGSLVYYKRFKAPAQAASHEGADASRKRLAKWYGPARVLATETKLIGEEATRPASFPWTMHGMLEQVEKGEFDDYEDLYPDGGLDASRMLRDPTYAPSSSISTELSGNRQFAAARKRHGVNFAEPVDQFMVDIGLEEQSGNGEAMVFLSVDLPDNEKGMKKFRRDPETWVAHKVKKSPEIKLHKVSAEKQEEFKAAKGLEVTQWIQSAACRAVEKGKYIPADRIMKMRWVLTVKSTGRAKARIVIVGFADPDLERLPRSSPTMTRRTRQLMAGMAVKGWSQLKCDAKSAFLQTSRNTEEEREIYALPVPELAEAMNVEHRQAVQVLKSCYGLVNAPYQWFCEVRDRIVSLGGQTLITEPCCWRIKNEEAVVIGLVGSHVDDFYMDFKDSYRWSPWEADGFDHCGIYMQQLSNREITMDHSKYCSGITQVSFEDRDVHDKASPEEVEQARAVLSAIQWRVQQSGRQHGAKLGQLMTLLPHCTVQVLKDINKLVREVYSQRMLCPKFQNLGCTAEETMLVCWTDAALASRADGGSTGGFVVALTALEMALGQRAPLTLESMKLKRVARSSLAAEVQAFSEGEQELMWCRLQWSEMLGNVVDLAQPQEASLYDSVTKGDAATSGMGLSDKYSALELMSVRERIQEGQTVIRWVHSGAQLADALTKHLVNSSLVKALTTGAWTLVDDPTFTSLKKRRAGGLMDVEKTPS